MATDVQTSEAFLAYDGDCPMCLATVALLLRLGLVCEQQTRSSHDLEGTDLAAAQAAGIRNQLVVVDPETGEARAGSDGLLWLVGRNTRYAWPVRLLSLPGLRHLLRWAYQTVSYNRRVISPPRHQITCDCEPEVTPLRRMALIVPLVVVSCAIVAGYGASVFVGAGLGPAAAGAVLLEVSALAGWLTMAVVGLTLLRGTLRLDYVAHLAVTMCAGALILLPAAAVTWLLPRPAAAAASVLSLMFCFSTMFKMQVCRVAAMRLKWPWLWGWAAALLAAFATGLGVYFRGELF